MDSRRLWLLLPGPVRRLPADLAAVDLLSNAAGRSAEDIRRARIVTEISRTDRTKRKDVLIRAFAAVRRSHPDAFLAVAIDKSNPALYEELTGLIAELELSGSVAVLGSIWAYIPSLYGLSAVYCTPSVMEGFGMSIQEAAACAVPAVASSRVPFAVEYLAKPVTREQRCTEDATLLRIGPGAVVVEPDSVGGTAEALDLLLSDDALRREMGREAYRITIPRFTWERATRSFLQSVGIAVPGEESER